MKRKFLCILLSTAIAFSFCSCGSTEKKEDNSTEQQEETANRTEGKTTVNATEDNTEEIEEKETIQDINIGDTFTLSDGTNELEITLNSVDFEQEVHSLVEDTNRFSQYYPDQEDETYVVMKLDIKNIGGDSISYQVFHNNILLTFDDKYNYKMIQLDTESIVMSGYWSIAPLKSQAVYFLQTVPDEVIDKSYVIEFSLVEGNLICRYDSSKDMKEEENSSVDVNSILEVENPEEEKYQAALTAESNNYYAYALRLFEEVVDYEDSNEHIESLKNILEPYNGDYIVELFAGGSYSMEINNGIVKAQFDHAGSSVYYFDLIGIPYNEIDIAMAAVGDYNDDGIPDYGIDSDYKDRETYSIIKRDNGGFVIMALDSNDYTYWNGSTQ